MTRTKAELLSNLDPHNPASIQALIDFHRETFGGWTMEGPEGAKPEGDQGQSGDQAKPEGGKPEDKGKPDDKPLGPNGEKALQAERDARANLEKQLNQLKSGLAAALGVDAKDAKSSTDDIMASLQQRIDGLERGNLVLSVVNENRITDADDLALLRDFKGDEASLRKLAARLKPADDKPGEQPKPQQRRTPAPDHSQGQGGGQKLSAREEGLAQARKRFPQPAK